MVKKLFLEPFLKSQNYKKKLWKDQNAETHLIETRILKIGAIFNFRGTTVEIFCGKRKNNTNI